jgi:Zn-dependent protease
MADPNLLLGGLTIAILVLSLGVHEAAHAWVAYRCGDTTARDLGRLTLNPVAHVDLFMTVLLPLLLFLSGAPLFGGAKPVPVNPHRLRHPLRDMSLVAAAGPASNVLLAIIFMLIFKALYYGGVYPPEALMTKVLYLSVRYNILLAVFNLIPIPPLDGSRIMAYLLPASLRESYVRLERFGMLLVIGFVFFIPQTRALLFGGMDATWDALDALTGGHWTWLVR